MPRYSYQSIFSTLTESPRIPLISTSNIADPVQLNQFVYDIVNTLSREAANNPSVKKFAATEETFTSTQTFYRFVQCTPSLTIFVCDSCIRRAISVLLTYPIGGNVLSPTCYIRYEFFPLYNVTAAREESQPPPPPPPSPPPRPSPDSEKKSQLDWTQRFKIIGGIARGILYLYEDLRLTIIHRDLKTSNILLDANMNPKISDFGTARIFVVDQTEANTNRVVGTFGYMSPEYAMQGHFSVKSDMFSFGILVLEILTGKNKRSFYQSDDAENLLSYASECLSSVWKHWRDGTALDILDETLKDSGYVREEAMRCIQIGLLCVQEDPLDRPTMATGVLMLSSCSMILSSPQRPAFLANSRTQAKESEGEPQSDAWTSKSSSSSQVSLSQMVEVKKSLHPN